MAKTDLRTFRHAVSVLKKKGLIKSSVNVRTAFPSQISEGFSLKQLIKKYADVIDDKAEAVHLTPQKTREYSKAGYETTKMSGGRVLVPKLKTDKVSVTKQGEIKITEKSGIERIKKAVPFENLQQWLRDMQKNKLRINAMKRRNELFGYKIFGHTSWNLYSNIEDLLEEMNNGASSFGTPLADRFPTHKSAEEFFQELEIVRVPHSRAWPEAPNRPRPFRPKGSGRKPTQLSLAIKRSKNAERQRKWRESLTKKEKEKYKRAARKRAIKSNRKSKRK